MASTGFLTEGGGLLKILYLGIRNSIEGLEDAAFTKSNRVGNVQLVANTTLADVEKLGCLAGSVAALKGEGVLGAGSSVSDKIVGLYVNDLAGNAYESTSAAASEKGVYVNGMGTYESGIYETHDAGAGAISYAFGDFLYCSQNGLLGNAAAVGSLTSAVIIGIVTKAPSASDPIMRFNLRL